VEVETEEFEYRGEALLLCTDGLTDMLKSDEIEAILQDNPDPQIACDLLVDNANDKGGRDNITVVVVRGKEG
jgi:protein phosphatase